MKLLSPTSWLNRIKDSREFRTSIVYTMASIMGHGIVFIQNFSLAFFLTKSDYGSLTLLISLFSTLFVIFTLGLNSVALRFVFEAKYQSNAKALTSHLFFVWSICGIPLLAAFGLIGYFGIIEYGILELSFAFQFLPILFGAFLFSFVEIFPSFFIVKHKPLHYAVSLIASRATIFILLHIGLLLFGSSANSAWLLLLSGLILCLVGIGVFKIFPFSVPRRADVLPILTYAFPLMLYALGGIGYSHGYRVLIGGLLSPEDLAVFSLTSQISAVFYLTATSSITGLYPIAYEALTNSGGNSATIKFYLKRIFITGVILLLILGPISWVFLKFFKNGEYEKGTIILPILLAGQFVYFLYAYNYILCTFHKKTKVLTYSMCVGVVVSLSLAFVLLERIGVLGAAIAVSSGLTAQTIFSGILIRGATSKVSEEINDQ
jgi:O-antigen/teichoic acid export membrane protein